MKASFFDSVRNLLILFKNSFGNPFAHPISTTIFCLEYFFSMSWKRVLYLKTRNGSRLYIRTKSSDLQVMVQHLANKELAREPIKSLDPNCILDGGSNIGLSIFVFSYLFPKARIIGLEPDEANFQILSKTTNTFKNRENIKLIKGAILGNDQSGLAIRNSPGLEFAASLDRERTGDVNAYSFNSIIENTGWDPDLIKLDIEGSEIELMEDQAGFLSMIRGRALVIELHGPKAFLKFFSIMEANGLRDLKNSGEYWICNQPKASS